MFSRVAISLGVLALLVGLTGSAWTRVVLPAVDLAPGDSVIVRCPANFVLMPQTGALQIQCSGESIATATIPTTPTATIAQPSPQSSVTQGVGVSLGGIWLSPAEISVLPTSGAGWSAVAAAARADWGVPKLADLNSRHDVYTLAGALVAARTNDSTLFEKTANAIMSAVGTEAGSRALEISRNIQGYVIAADLIKFSQRYPNKDQQFRSWLATVRAVKFDGMSIIDSSERRPNNWGTHAIAARIAIDRYLGDTADLQRSANVFRGWLGDRSAYSGFSYGDLSWQANRAVPVGINPKGAQIAGHNVDGVLPDDQRRAGSFSWPPPCENYVHEALQGALVAATMLQRAGYDSWGWGDRALLRSYNWLYIVASCPASGDDGGYPYLINRAYGTTYSGARPAPMGKNMGWLDWTHGS